MVIEWCLFLEIGDGLNEGGDSWFGCFDRGLVTEFAESLTGDGAY